MKKSIFIYLLAALSSTSALANSTVNIYVGPKNSLALENAKQIASAEQSTAARTLTKAFNAAAKKLVDCNGCTVNIKVANGQYLGKAKTGMWNFPDVIAPKSTLRILGGYNDDFSERAPFTHATILQTSKRRSAPILRFLGKKHALKELVLSGLVIDASPSNNYDVKTNSLNRSGSSTYGVLSFGYLTTNKLVIADNVFMNAIHGVAEPLIRAMTPEAEVIIRNNFMMNNIMNWRIGAGGYKHTVKHYQMSGNSFILNWPYNPDTTTALVGGVIIGNKYSAKLVSFTDNLFAYNVGGAIMPNFAEGGGPDINVKNNLFYDNGHMFPSDGADDGAFVGKFNGSGTHISLSMEDIEDDFDWVSENNVSIDPELSIPMVKLKALNQEKPAAGSSPEVTDPEPSAETSSSGEFNIDDLLSDEDIVSEPDFQMDEMAEEGNIKNFAPHMPYHPDVLPFPANSDAQAYGANANQVQNYE